MDPNVTLTMKQYAKKQSALNADHRRALTVEEFEAPSCHWRHLWHRVDGPDDRSSLEYFQCSVCNDRKVEGLFGYNSTPVDLNLNWLRGGAWAPPVVVEAAAEPLALPTTKAKPRQRSTTRRKRAAD